MKEGETLASVNDCYKLLEQISRQINSSEELLRILAVNELLDEVNIDDNEIEENIDNEVEQILEVYNVNICKIETFKGKTLIFLTPETTWQIKSIISIYIGIVDLEVEIIPVFQFEKVHGTQKKRLEQEKISFYIEDKEMHIFV